VQLLTLVALMVATAVVITIINHSDPSRQRQRAQQTRYQRPRAKIIPPPPP
jgi:hypothetical protein